MGLENIPLHFDYEKIDSKYWAAASPDAVLTLYKGAVRMPYRQGILSCALHAGNEHLIPEMKALIESGDEAAIQAAIDKHTSSSYASPLLSAAFDPKQAQVYAPHRSKLPWLPMGAKKQFSTIYQIQVQADRCIIDADNIGCLGTMREVFILGKIQSQEITAIKKNNTDLHSELLYTDESGLLLLARFSDRNSTNTSVRDPTNWYQVQ